jgi:thymidine kinase
MNNTHNPVQLTFFSGPMRTGKSYQLMDIALSSVNRVVCFAPKMGKAQPVISSGDCQVNALPLTPFTANVDARDNLLQTIRELTKLFFPSADSSPLNSDKYTLIIDECQFLAKSTIDALLEIISRLSDYNRLESVYIAGLDTDVAGQPFPATHYLLSELDGIKIIKPREILCAVCGRNPATHNMRIFTEVDSLVVVSKDGYQSVCELCFSPVYVVNNIIWENT